MNVVNSPKRKRSLEGPFSTKELSTITASGNFPVYRSDSFGRMSDCTNGDNSHVEERCAARPLHEMESQDRADPIHNRRRDTAGFARSSSHIYETRSFEKSPPPTWTSKAHKFDKTNDFSVMAENGNKSNLSARTPRVLRSKMGRSNSFPFRQTRLQSPSRPGSSRALGEFSTSRKRVMNAPGAFHSLNDSASHHLSPATPFRFTSFPDSLPRVGPRSICAEEEISGCALWSSSSEDDNALSKSKNDVSVDLSDSHQRISRRLGKTPHPARARRRRRCSISSSTVEDGASSNNFYISPVKTNDNYPCTSNDSCISSISGGSMSPSASYRNSSPVLMQEDTKSNKKDDLPQNRLWSPLVEVEKNKEDAGCIFSEDDDYATDDAILLRSKKKEAVTRLNFDSLLSPAAVFLPLEYGATPSNVVLKEVPTTDVTHIYGHQSPVTQNHHDGLDLPSTHKIDDLDVLKNHEASLGNQMDQNSSSNFSLSPILSENRRKQISKIGMLQQSSASLSPLQAESTFMSENHNSLNVTTTTNSSVTSSSTQTRKFRPIPDEAAFDGPVMRRHSNAMSPIPSPPVCPPTPVRTPNWAKKDHTPSLSRKSSLITTKVLAETTEYEDFGTRPLHDDSESSASFDNDFEIIGKLGTGTFADVYKCRYKKDNSLYAIKRNRRQFRGKKDRQMALAEVLTMQSLEAGPSVCLYLLRFLKAWQEDGYFYCQTELCSSGSCRQLMSALLSECKSSTNMFPSLMRYSELSSSFASGQNKGRIAPEDAVWKICHDVCSGLHHIHKLGMVHHDIKPSNIFFTTQGEHGCICKIGDFGMAGTTGTCDDGQEGDAAYMPSELLMSSEKHPWSDMFSLGLSLYEFAADCFFELPTEGHLWHEIRSGIPPELPDRSQELISLIHELMNPVPLKRPLSSEVVLNEKVRAGGTTYCKYLVSYLEDLNNLEKEREQQAIEAYNVAVKRSVQASFSNL